MTQVTVSAEQIVREDLDYICDKARSEFEQLSNKRLLLTGGGGFLGYYLAQSVVHWNALHPGKRIDLTVYDNFIRGVPKWLTQLGQDKGLTLVQHNVAASLPAAMPDFDYIIHAASIASPMHYRMYPIETMDTNVNGLRLLLDYCRNQQQRSKPIAGMLFFSTSEIYGDPTPEAIPTPETYRGNVSCTGPRAAYDESKRYGETLCANFVRQYDLPIKTARPFNNYGPGLRLSDRRALPDFARDILAGRDIVLYSDGSPTRTFCYVTDAVVGYYKILVRGTAGEAYNIGVEKPEISITELAQRVVSTARDIFGYGGRVIHQTSSDKDYLVDNPNRRCPIIVKAQTELDYQPTVTLDEGVRRSLIWYAENQDAEEKQQS